LRICKASLTELAIQMRSQRGSHEKNENVFRQRKEEGGGPVGILLRIAGGGHST